MNSGNQLQNGIFKDREQDNIHIPINNIGSGIYAVKIKTSKRKRSAKIIANQKKTKPISQGNINLNLFLLLIFYIYI